MPDEVITLDKSVLTALGAAFSRRYDEHDSNRRSTEEQWMRNYRQYRGIYDDNITIPDNFSRAYPKITRVKVKSLVAKLMEMLFPATERGWSIASTPIPNIGQEELQSVLDELAASVQQQQQEAAQGQQTGQPPEEVVELTDDVIEKAIKEFVSVRAQNMSDEMDDQLKEIDYVSIVKKVIKSAVQYGVGVMRGPMVTTTLTRSWQKDDAGNYAAVEEEINRPYFEFVSVWDWLPDFSIKDFAMNDGFFERHLMNRHEVYGLVDRPDFFKDEIESYLQAHQDGDYSESDVDMEMRGVAKKDETPGKTTHLYNVRQYVGYVTVKDFTDAGLKVAADSEQADVLVDMWMLGETPIKMSALPYDNPLEFYHVFVFDGEEEASPIGPALPENVRDSQMTVCAATRMLIDNAGITTGPIFEINRDLLAPGQENTDIHAFRIFWREGTGAEANYPAVRALKFDSHVPELMNIINQFREMSDEESMLPKFAIGSESRPSEGLRTAAGTSMLFGASNTTLKDIVRQFDMFTVSAMRALYKWNMLFSNRTDIQGDYQLIARGSTSLIAKEIRAQALDNMAQTMSDGERQHINDRKWLIERMKVRDLDGEGLLLDEEEVAQNQKEEFELRKRELDAKIGVENARAKKLLTSAAKEISDASNKGNLTTAQIAEIMSRTEKNLVAAGTDEATSQLEYIRALQDERQNITMGGEVLPVAEEQTSA